MADIQIPQPKAVDSPPSAGSGRRRNTAADGHVKNAVGKGWQQLTLVDEETAKMARNLVYNAAKHFEYDVKTRGDKDDPKTFYFRVDAPAKASAAKAAN